MSTLVNQPLRYKGNSNAPLGASCFGVGLGRACSATPPCRRRSPGGPHLGGRSQSRSGSTFPIYRWFHRTR
jgi:hypothetical protein